MMNEIKNIHQAVDPSETLFVVDSMTGQDAVNTAKTFNDIFTDFDGVVLTKLDGDTRGGAALSIKSVVDKPIKFIGTGEKMDAIDVFTKEWRLIEFLEWETSYHWLKKHRTYTMKNKQDS